MVRRDGRVTEILTVDPVTGIGQDTFWYFKYTPLDYYNNNNNNNNEPSDFDLMSIYEENKP